MKQLLILSGKGGTGKTTLASAFIKLADVNAYADCDVDAPNLHLVMGWLHEPKTSDYFGLPKAFIDPELCNECDLCRQHCRFNAITAEPIYQVSPFACEGCGVCAYVCPTQAITMQPSVDGELMLYSDPQKVFSTAQLKMGSGTSGMLVSNVKKQMHEAAPQADFAIIDGSPGIGCPVIASISGVDMVLIVTEPSLSGISDMERIVHTVANFGAKTAVCINKFDTNLSNSENIEDYCKNHELPFLGKIPFDKAAVKAINNGLSIVDLDCPSGTAAKEIYIRTLELLNR